MLRVVGLLNINTYIETKPGYAQIRAAEMQASLPVLFPHRGTSRR